MSCLFSSVDLETWPHTFITALAFMLCLLPRTSLTPFSLPDVYPVNFLPCTFSAHLLSHRYLCLLLRPPTTTCTEHRTNTDQSGQHLLTGLKKFCPHGPPLPMNYFPPKSNPSLIHIFKWRWDSHYLKLVLLKCNSVALNAFRMLGNHIDLVLERFHDSESNPECVKQYPAHTSLSAPGRHSSAFCLSLWICLFWTVHTSGIIP